MCEKLDILTKVVPPGAHWALGGVERHHAQLRKVTSIMVQKGLTLGMAVEYAALVHNLQPQGDMGFSPHQVVFGST